MIYLKQLSSNYINSLTNTTVKIVILSLIFFGIVMTGLSCDGMDLYEYANDNANYGPVWSPALTGNIATLYFPEEAENATVLSNYSAIAINNGTVSISAVNYDSELKRADLSITFTGTDGSGFFIMIVPSAAPIKMGGAIIEGQISPVYPTTDLYAPTVEDFLPKATASSIGTHTINVVFSEPMAESIVVVPSNYLTQYSGSITMSIISVTYTPATYTANVTFEIFTGTTGDQYRIAPNNSITDAAGNSLTTTYSQWYTLE